MWGIFDQRKDRIEHQYSRVQWIPGSGETPEQMESYLVKMTQDGDAQGIPRSLLKSSAIAYILDHSMLAVEPSDLFQDHIRHGFLVQKQREKWITEEREGLLRDVMQEAEEAEMLGIGAAHSDFGHTVPDWYALLSLGFPGLLERIRTARDKHDYLSHEQEIFYQSSEMVYEAVIRYVKRLAEAVGTYQTESEEDRQRMLYCAQDLSALAEGAPQTLHQALQMTYLYHILQEEIEGERLRSLGGVDRLYSQFMQNDLENGRLTIQNIYEIWQNFFQKFHALGKDKIYGEPLYIGGTLKDGTCAVNDFTYMILHAYDSLNVANPKLHIRISTDTPKAFVKEVLDSIRRGNSAFVFISDEVAIPMLQKYLGASLEEAREYVPVGCYEPAILGKEVPCTENGGISLPKVLELTLNDGIEPVSGKQKGLKNGGVDHFSTFELLVDAVKAEICHTTERMAEIVRTCEKRYMFMNPSPLFSATLEKCVQDGKDAYAGGAVYNSSSLYGYSNATLTDSLWMIRKYVFERHEMTLEDLNNILLSNWENNELLRLRLRKDPEKWGNGIKEVDQLGADLCNCFADAVNSQPNNRGGHFKAALFSIDHNYPFGKHCGATADGRKKGEHLSRNCGAATAMDRNGITALIRSVTRLDFSRFPNGSVLDIMLHPSAVMGEDGLEAFYQLLMVYFQQGGFAIHGNVMDAEVLKEARKHPEQYRNLQVRVCGWNVYFVNLSPEEQEEFIQRAEV